MNKKINIRKHGFISNPLKTTAVPKSGKEKRSCQDIDREPAA
jgi:hypothetical protein